MTKDLLVYKAIDALLYARVLIWEVQEDIAKSGEPPNGRVERCLRDIEIVLKAHEEYQPDAAQLKSIEAELVAIRDSYAKELAESTESQ